MSAEEIPESWCLTSVGEVSELIAGSGFPKEQQGRAEGEYPFAKVGDISEAFRAGRQFMSSANHYISDEVRRQLKAKIFPPGSIVFPKIGEALKGNYRVITARPMLFDNNVMGVGPDKRVIEGKYLYYFLSTQDFGKFAVATAVPSVRGGDIASIVLGLPPVNEQRRIVAKIDELFSELDKGVESLITAREQLKAYRQSVFNRAVVGEVAGSPTFSIKPLSAVVSDLGQGWSPRCLNHPAADDDTWAVITTTAIQHGVFQQQENKQLPEELEPRPHLAIRAGDILITRAGPRKRVGVACLVRHCRPRLMLCDKAYRLRANSDEVLPEWLELVLNSPAILQKIEELKTGISDSGVNLTQNRFLELEVPVPGLAKQGAVLARVESLTSQMTNLDAQIEIAMHHSDALRQSILRRAFSGQLVSQDAADEPASVLLKRVLAERQGSGERKRRNNKNGKQEAA